MIPSALTVMGTISQWTRTVHTTNTKLKSWQLKPGKDAHTTKQWTKCRIALDPRGGDLTSWRGAKISDARSPQPLTIRTDLESRCKELATLNRYRARLLKTTTAKELYRPQ